MKLQKNTIIFIKAEQNWLIRISKDTQLEDGTQIPADFCLCLHGSHGTYPNSEFWGIFKSDQYTVRNATLEEIKLFYSKFPELSRSCNNYEAY